MKRTFMRAEALTGLLLVVLALFAIRAVAQQPGTGPNPSQGRPMMMGMGPGMMGMNHDSQTMAEMSAIHELVVNHDRIKRTVTNLPDGIRTVTESDDPKIAKYIQEHVASMDKRVSARSDPGLPIESPALRMILRNGDKVRTTVETTANGVVVTQTSPDPDTVMALQTHAAEVNDLVQRGMVAIHETMMKNHGMHGGMMTGAPSGGSTSKPQ
jgi:hypothetical protein